MCVLFFQEIWIKGNRGKLDLQLNAATKQRNESIMDESRVSKHRMGKRTGISKRCQTNRELYSESFHEISENKTKDICSIQHI